MGLTSMSALIIGTSIRVNGGAFGFNTETGIGAQLPVRESIEKMIPADKRWPVDQSVWNYHCTASTSAMNTLDVLDANHSSQVWCGNRP